MNIFEKRESVVRSYCRKYPVVFKKALNAEMFSEDGERYVDFLAVAGSMNYGHNNPEIKKAVLDYLADDNIINALDMYTSAKEEFLTEFERLILSPRKLDYKVMCCGPTGTNAVEAALKLARKNKKRTNVIAFAGAFHGMSLGSLALTTDKTSREGGSVPLTNVSFVPYDGTFDSLAYLRWVLEDDHSGVDKPAAIILETVQAERAGIVPDMVVMSKSISGFGMPMALLLIKPELDIFRPAEHNGTFRGNQLSFIGGTAGIRYFTEHKLDEEVRRKGQIIDQFIQKEILPMDARLVHRGIGMIWGIDFNGITPEKAIEVIHKAFDNHLILEVAGRHDGVVKIMPPLTIEDDTLMEGLQIVKKSIAEVLN